MAKEIGLVFDKRGRTLYWINHAGRTWGSIPDSRDLWVFLWDHRDEIGGVAHVHPWEGSAWYSETDVTTFAAVEAGLGKRLIWAIVTLDHIGYFRWTGPHALNYGRCGGRRFRLKDINELRQQAVQGEKNGNQSGSLECDMERAER
jgi:hypothetical protein